MENDVVSLNVSKEVIAPIVNQHIKNAVIEAMGGKDELISKVVNNILTQKVDANGKVGNYSSDNKYNWIDIVLTKEIQEQVKNELQSLIKESASKIKKELINKLKTQAGASQVANALLAGLADTFKSNWSSKVAIEINQKKD
jgi:hypothetical protein